MYFRRFDPDRAENPQSRTHCQSLLFSEIFTERYPGWQKPNGCCGENLNVMKFSHIQQQDYDGGLHHPAKGERALSHIQTHTYCIHTHTHVRAHRVQKPDKVGHKSSSYYPLPANIWSVNNPLTPLILIGSHQSQHTI